MKCDKFKCETCKHCILKTRRSEAVMAYCELLKKPKTPERIWLITWARNTYTDMRCGGFVSATEHVKNYLKTYGVKTRCPKLKESEDQP